MQALPILLSIIVIALIALAGWLAMMLVKVKKRYEPIVDMDGEVERLKNQAAGLEREFAQRKKALERDVETLQKDYANAQAVYRRLRAEVGLLEENLNDISFGLYQPHFNFEDPEEFKAALNRVYSSQKEMVRKDGGAVLCPNDWTVNGSKREGAKMVKQESKLMLRAFNAEVDAAVSRVSWNNIAQMEQRILKAYDAVNELGSVMRIQITKAYYDLALKELRLTHEFEARKQQIKEEQRQIREQMREEELAQREFERAKKAAEAEEQRYQKALQAARNEIEKAKAEEAVAIAQKIQALESKLSEAQAKLEHAVSMAQLTKSGHVYVISNIGSFGDDVYKIGMTRRLDPTERVDELGSASVPFPYDIHAMIYAADAPALENAFHKEFSGRRVNRVNLRKEFFKVSLEELEAFARRHNASIEFTKLAEAREYRQTLSFLADRVQGAAPAAPATEEFPETLFAVR